MIIKNKGMLLEDIINNSVESEYFLLNKINANNKIVGSIENNLLKVRVLDNNFCDYIGIYKNKYIEIEAKETELEYFNLSNIKKHQIEKLIKVKKFGGLSLIFIYSHINDCIYVLSIDDIMLFTKRKIDLSWFEDNAYKIEIDSFNIDLVSVFEYFY